MDGKGTSYRGIAGLFTREFENGWAVYNRSGSARRVAFKSETRSVHGGQTARNHAVPDMDGEIFLK